MRRARGYPAAIITRTRTLLALLVLVTSAACSADSSGPANTGPCTGDVVVTASGGTTPTFSWTPACRVTGLLVEEGASDTWFLEAIGVGIAPSVTYGSPPAGATEE